MSIVSTTAMPTEMPEIRGGVQTSLVSRPPSTLQEEKGSGEYSTTFFCTSTRLSVAQSDWLIWQLSHLYWAYLPQTT